MTIPGWLEPKKSSYSIILLKLRDAIVNIATSKMAITSMSIGRLAKSPVIMRLLVASTT